MGIFNVYSEKELEQLAPAIAAAEEARIAFRVEALGEYYDALEALRQSVRENKGTPDPAARQRFEAADSNRKTAKANYMQAMALKGKAMRSIRPE